MRMRILAVGLLLLAAPAFADWYRVTVTRKGSNVYRDSVSGVYIITRACYEYATEDDAVLRYDKYDKWDNRLVFAKGAECAVVEVR